MKYSSKNPSIAQLIDAFKTGHYGEDRYDDEVSCSECGGGIGIGEQYYDVEGIMFCSACSSAADECILEKEREKYMFEL